MINKQDFINALPESVLNTLLPEDIEDTKSQLNLYWKSIYIGKIETHKSYITSIDIDSFGIHSIIISEISKSIFIYNNNKEIFYISYEDIKKFENSGKTTIIYFNYSAIVIYW